jgi:DNA-binding NtrC family response regulator
MSKVLIVDDQSAVRTALEVLFEVHDLEATSVASPAEALARIALGDVAAVLQDMNFGEGTTSGAEGVALFRAIRKLDPAMPVVLMTAWSSLETAMTLVDEGASDYLGKPWDDDELVTSIRDLLRLRALEAQNVRASSVRAATEPSSDAT